MVLQDVVYVFLYYSCFYFYGFNCDILIIVLVAIEKHFQNFTRPEVHV